MVARTSQKGIVVGKGGSRIASIGARARVAIAALSGRPCHLFLKVEVLPAWTKDPSKLKQLGYAVEAEA